MRLLPVLDLKGGVVVRGVGGRRAEYRPIVSRWTNSVRPVDVAEALRTHFGLSHFYLADLDAIAGAAPALALYHEFRCRGLALWVDAGVRDEGNAEVLATAGVEGIIVGLETVRGPETLEQLLRRYGAGRLIFSLDLKEGRPFAAASTWQETEAFDIAAAVIRRGVRCLIVLDLARVGGGSGTGTEDLCRRIVQTYPDVELVAGGGVRDVTDLQRLEELGVKMALVASALHDGRLSASYPGAEPRDIMPALRSLGTRAV